MLNRVTGGAILVALAFPALALDVDEAEAIKLVRNYGPTDSGPTIAQMLTRDVLPFFFAGPAAEYTTVIGWSARQREHGWYVVIFTIRVIQEDFNYVFAVNPTSDPVVVAPLEDMAESLWP